MAAKLDGKKLPGKSESDRWGKGASDLTPEERKIDPIVGFVLAASLPLALIVFWKVTIPFAYFAVSTVLGAEALQKISFLSQDISHLLTSQCPPWITAEERAFLERQNFRHVRRFHDVSREEFAELVGEGEPFIVTDAAEGAFPDGVDCAEFISSYPEAEYLDWQSQSRMLLKDMTARSGYTGMDCASGAVDCLSRANEKYLKGFLRHMPLPYFLDEDSFLANDSYSSMTSHVGATGTGTPPHVEESCSSFVAAQVDGVTSWSFSRPVVENGEFRWSKPLRVYLQPGDTIVWFPSIRYHTEVADGCSINFKFGFQSPAPKKYVGQVLQDLSSLSEVDGVGSPSSSDASGLDFLSKCYP